MPSHEQSPFPAELILSPENHKHYVLFQRHRDSPSPKGEILQSIEYQRFLEYLKSDCNATDLSLASSATQAPVKCNHLLHPATVAKIEFCPICRVGIHLSFLSTIQSGLSRRGGPWRTALQLPEVDSTIAGSEEKRQKLEEGARLLDAWYIAKLNFLELLSVLHKKAESEEKWEKEHSDVEVEDLGSAKAALQLAARETRDPTMYLTAFEVSNFYAKNGFNLTDFAVKKKNNKTVRFAEKVEFGLPIKKDNRDIKKQMFKSMSRLPNGARMKIEQLKVYTVGSKKELGAVAEDPALLLRMTPDTIVGLHKMKEHIGDAALQGKLEGRWKSWTRADAVVVRVKWGGRVKEVLPLRCEVHVGTFELGIPKTTTWTKGGSFEGGV
jgi:hypothetical protein